MYQFLQALFDNLLVEVICTILIGFVTTQYYRFAKEQKRRDAEQKKRDEEQDRINEQWRAEFDQKLKRQEYLEKQRFEAYKKIRQVAQKARDHARTIEMEPLLLDDEGWIKALSNEYENIRELLYEHALLLQHFGQYEFLHKYKNAFLRFYLAAKDFNRSGGENRSPLLHEFEELLKHYEVLTAQIRLTNESSGTAELESA